MRNHLLRFTAFMMVLLSVPVMAAEFDIPLTELQKIRKKPAKRTESNSRRKAAKKVAEPAQPNNAETNQPDSLKSSAATLPEPALQEAAPAPASTAVPVAAPSPAANSSINHSPYSYVVAGRRTALHAVVVSDTPVARVYCYFRAIGSSYGAAVPMTKVNDTRFTYSTTLPALAAESRGLRYRIYMVDTGGGTTQSPDYEIPVMASTVFPGWQPDHFNDPIQLTIDDDRKMLEGFADPTFLHKKP